MTKMTPDDRRRDWEKTKARHAEYKASLLAAEQFPESPVASRYERKFRKRYVRWLAHTAPTESPREFLKADALGNRWLMYMTAALATAVGIVTGVAGFWEVLSLWGVTYTVALLSTWYSYSKFDEMIADRAAYLDWKETYQ